MIDKIRNLKYSNNYLFERREKEKAKEKEKERILSEDNKRKSNFNSTQTQNHKRNNSQFPIISNYPTLTTMNSSMKQISSLQGSKSKRTINSTIQFYDSLDFKSARSRNTYSNLNNINSIYTNSTISNFYLTESPFITIQTERISKHFRTFSSDNEKKGKEIKEENGDKKEKSSLKLLKTFEKNTNDLTETISPIKTEIDLKTNKLKLKKQSIHDIIDKTRDIILYKYSIDRKKERTIRLQEINENNIGKFQNTITIMKNTNKLFHDKFFQKFSDYVKELETQREIEKAKNTNLIQQIIKQKNELTQIETQIRKQEYDKNNIIRWIFFQILVKEKKLNLPNHYKSLIEETEENMRKIFSNPANFSSEDNDLRYKYKKQMTKKKIERKATRKSIILDNKNSFTSKPTFTLSIYKNISMKEALRIRNYKYNLCYQTPEEFFYKIKKLEYTTLKFIEEYNNNLILIRELKKERDEIIKEKEHQIKIENEDLQEKENQLIIQKHKFDILKTEKYNLNNLMIETENNENIKKKEKRKSIFDISSDLNKKKKSNLYNSITNLFQTCSQIQLNQIINMEILINRKISSKESEMMDMMSKIEIIVDYLLSKINEYKNNKYIGFNLFKKILSEIDKSKKIENSKKQKDEQNKKLEKLKEKIKKRDNKIYFLPRRKIEKNFSSEQIKHKKKIIEDVALINPGLYDFIYSSDEEINVDY